MAATTAVTPPTTTSNDWAAGERSSTPDNPQQHHAAEVHHTCVEQGGHRRRRLHHLDQPAVERQLGALQDDRQRHEQHADLRAGRQAACGCAGGQLVQPRGVEGGGERDDRTHEAELGQAGQHELLVGHREGHRAVALVGEEAVQREAGGGPGECNEDQVVGHYHHGHSAQCRRQALGGTALVRVARQVLRRVADDHPTDDADEGQHCDGDRVQPQQGVRPVARGGAHGGEDHGRGHGRRSHGTGQSPCRGGIWRVDQSGGRCGHWGLLGVPHHCRPRTTVLSMTHSSMIRSIQPNRHRLLGRP